MTIEIRRWKLSDLDNLVRYANNKSISDNLADAFPYPYTRDFGKDFIERVGKDDPCRIFAISMEEEAIGSIGIFPDADIHRKNAAIAYWIAEPFWGQGITLKAIRLILNYGFDELKLNRIYAKPFGSNANSHRVLEKAGFRLEATLPNVVLKNGKFLDERIYGVNARTHDSST
jgi:RimJ/RimL family protein N-acetyltransferase